MIKRHINYAWFPLTSLDISYSIAKLIRSNIIFIFVCISLIYFDRNPSINTLPLRVRRKKKGRDEIHRDRLTRFLITSSYCRESSEWQVRNQCILMRFVRIYFLTLIIREKCQMNEENYLVINIVLSPIDQRSFCFLQDFSLLNETISFLIVKQISKLMYCKYWDVLQCSKQPPT